MKLCIKLSLLSIFFLPSFGMDNSSNASSSSSSAASSSSSSSKDISTENKKNDKDTNELSNYQLIEPDFPSYVDYNHFGLCLRASKDLEKGTIVGTANFQKIDKPFIAGDPEYKHIALMHVSKDGVPTWGKVRGKWRFCNHSCDPNCDTSDTCQAITNRDIKKGQELTVAYDSYIPNLPWQETWNFECLCQSSNCKKLIKEYRTDLLWPGTAGKYTESK